MEKIIKTGFCVAYDWELLKHSLPKIYEESDIICLALDKDRHSWACNAYEFDDDAFYAFVKSVDVDSKIDMYEDDFSIKDLNARENCNRHRTLIADRMGKGGWHIQVDADEYFLDFKEFVSYLKSINKNPTGDEKPLNVCVNWIPIFKNFGKDFFYVDFKNRLPECTPIATNKPIYERARNNGHFNKISPYFVIHETWARSEDELQFKLNNWGHSAEELQEQERRKSFLKIWKSIDKYNYNLVYNIHPAKPDTWPALSYCAAKNLDDFVNKLGKPKFPLNKLQIALKNNRLVAKIKSLM